MRTQFTRTGRRGMFRAFPRWLCATAVLLAVATAAPAEAQLAGSFEQLQLLVGPDDRITVTNTSGRELSGSIDSLSPSTLTLLVRGTPFALDEADVGAIRQRRPDSLANGAVNGFLVGTLATVLMFSDGGAHPALWLSVLGIAGGSGAGAGVLVDALIEGERVIYRPRGAARRLTVSPLLSRERQGVAVSFSF